MNDLETLDENVKEVPKPGQRKLTPNAIKCMIWGIVSIAAGGLIVTAFIFGGMALSYASQDKRMIQEDPLKYASAAKMIRAGRITAIIGMCITPLWVLYMWAVIALQSY